DRHAEVDPVVAGVFRFSAKTLDSEVLGVVSAVVPADGDLPRRIHSDSRLEVIMSATELGLMVRVHLDGWAKMHPIFGATEHDVRVNVGSRSKDQWTERNEYSRLIRRIAFQAEAGQIWSRFVAPIIPGHVHGAVAWSPGVVYCQVQPGEVAELPREVLFRLNRLEV